MNESTRQEIQEPQLESEKENSTIMESRTHLISTEGKSLGIVFHRANERLPISSELQERRVFSNVVIDKLDVDEDDKAYRLEMAKTTGEIHTPSGYLDENLEIPDESIFMVGTNPRQIREVHERIYGNENNKEYSPEEQERYDKRDADFIIASAIFDTDGDIKAEQDDEAYLLYWRVLSGDVEAYEEMQKRTKILDERRKQEYERVVAETTDVEGGRQVEPLSIEDLVLVHTTKYLPKRGKINSTFDATDVPRNSIHFSLNHPVSGHMMGNWNDVPNVVIAPLTDAITANGLPAVLNTVDTFFETFPDEGFTIPDGSIVVQPANDPESIEEGELFTRRGDKVYYRTSLEGSDIAEVIGKLSSRERRNINTDIFRSLGSLELFSGDDWSVVNPNDYEKSWMTKDQHVNLLALVGDILEPRDFLSEISERGLSEILFEIFDTANITDSRRDEVVKSIVNDLNGKLISQIKSIAVHSTIREMGFQAHRGGMWAWDGNSWTATDQTKALGAEMNVPVMPHNSHFTHEFQEFFIGGFGRRGLYTEYQNGDIDTATFRSELFNFVSKNAHRMSREMLHMTLEMGAL